MKKVLSIVLALTILVCFTACSSGSNNQADTTAATQAGATAAPTVASTAAPTAAPTAPPTTAAPAMTTLANNQTISIPGVCDFYVEKSQITTKVTPPQPGQFYSTYNADAGKVYVDVCISYKNTSPQNIGADDAVSGKLIYSGMYEYNGFSCIEEDSRSDFTYSNITSIAPLSTEYIHLLFHVPQEIQTNTAAPVAVQFTVNGTTYAYNVR